MFAKIPVNTELGEYVDEELMAIPKKSEITDKKIRNYA